MARTPQVKRKIPPIAPVTPIIIGNGKLVPLSPFYLFFRKEIMNYGRKLDDDEIDQILQKDETVEDNSSNVDPSNYFFFGICEDIKMHWQRDACDEHPNYESDYEKLQKHYDDKKKKKKLCLGHHSGSDLSSDSNNQVNISTNAGMVKCGLKLVYDAFLEVCEFLNVQSIINLSLVSKEFNNFHNQHVDSLMNSKKFVQYFARRGIDPRLSMLLNHVDDMTTLPPKYQQFKDSLQLKIVIDFKVLDRQPGGNYDDFIVRQVAYLSTKKTQIFQSRIRNYDDCIYENDLIVAIQTDTNQLRSFIRSVCKLISSSSQQSTPPLIFKPNLTHQYIFTSKDDTQYYDEPSDWSQIEVSITNHDEMVFNFVKVSVPLDEFNILPFQESSSASELVTNAITFCNVETKPTESASEEFNSMAQTSNVYKKGLLGNSKDDNEEGEEDDEEEEDEEEEEEDDQQDSRINLERENDKMWEKFLNK